MEPVPPLDADECRRRFTAARVATLATTNADGGADLVPVTYALVGDVILTAVDHKPKSTRRLRRLDNIARQPAVALLADHYTDYDWAALWWVRAHGTATVSDEVPGSLLDALVAKYAPYADAPPAGPFIVVPVDRWSGWAATAARS